MTENHPINKVIYWQPLAGNSITGNIQGTGASNDLLYAEQKILFLQKDNGIVVGVDLNRYLIHNLKQHNAALGDLVTVTFHGKEQKNNGRSFNRYTLFVEKLTI
ncbi:MAG: hypothetical protein RIQ94_2378 [Pseudomonadota bacterium]|jgi:hypothetical protein